MLNKYSKNSSLFCSIAMIVCVSLILPQLCNGQNLFLSNIDFCSVDNSDARLNASLNIGTNLWPIKENIYDVKYNELQDHKYHSTTFWTFSGGISLEIWPLYFRNFGYGYGRNYEAGWLFNSSSSQEIVTHSIYLGPEAIQAIYSYEEYDRRSQQYLKKGEHYAKYRLYQAKSNLQIQRNSLGLRFKMGDHTWMDIQYINEINNLNNLKISGMKWALWESSSYKIVCELLIDYPAMGMIKDSINGQWEQTDKGYGDKLHKNLMFRFNFSNSLDLYLKYF